MNDEDGWKAPNRHRHFHRFEFLASRAVGVIYLVFLRETIETLHHIYVKQQFNNDNNLGKNNNNNIQKDAEGRPTS
jgi:hypothetical protein